MCLLQLYRLNDGKFLTSCHLVDSLHIFSLQDFQSATGGSIVTAALTGHFCDFIVGNVAVCAQSFMLC